MLHIKAHIYKTETEDIVSEGCKYFIGGIFKGAGGYNVTLSYLDCSGTPSTITTVLPSNPNPGNSYPFELLDPICVQLDTVDKVTIFPLLGITYGDTCT